MVKNGNCLLHVTCKTGVIFNSARRTLHLKKNYDFGPTMNKIIPTPLFSDHLAHRFHTKKCFFESTHFCNRAFHGFGKNICFIICDIDLEFCKKLVHILFEMRVKS